MLIFRELFLTVYSNHFELENRVMMTLKCRSIPPVTIKPKTFTLKGTHAASLIQRKLFSVHSAVNGRMNGIVFDRELVSKRNCGEGIGGRGGSVETNIK